MIPRPPTSTLYPTLFPYTDLLPFCQLAGQTDANTLRAFQTLLPANPVLDKEKKTALGSPRIATTHHRRSPIIHEYSDTRGAETAVPSRPLSPLRSHPFTALVTAYHFGDGTARNIRDGKANNRRTGVSANSGSRV
jgi:hypothetical protein